MTERRFLPLFICQFCSALNDNFLKNALGMLILFGIGTQALHQAHPRAMELITLSGVVFIAPFFFLSALGGEIADKYDKARVAERIKFFEIPVAALAAAGFYLHSIPVLFLALAGFGIIGALFGPVKYGILPEKLSTSELPSGNALVEAATFLAILLGTIFGGLAVTAMKSPELVVATILALAIVCWVSARAIPAHGPADPDLVITRNPLRSTFSLLAELRAEPRLWVGGQITSWFWLVGFIVLSLLPGLVKDRIGGSEGVVTLCLATFTIGIALGSMLAAKASHERPNLALVPAGGILMGLAALALAWLSYAVPAASVPADPWTLLMSRRGMALLAGLFVLAVAGGLFIVPSFAAVQAWAPPEKRARVIAAVNVLNAAYMTVAGAVVALLQWLGAEVHHLFAVLGIGSIVVAALVLKGWGKEGVRDLGRGIFRLAYGLEVRGIENLPKAGERVIIAPNHVSMLEAPMLHAILPGHAAFAVNTDIAEVRWIKPFLKLVNTYKLDPTKPLATRGLVNTLREGQTIVIFPEGRITTTGSLMKVYDGTAMIADKADAWIVPVRIDGAERSPWSYLRPSQIRKALFPQVSITFLPPVKLKLDPALRGKVRRQTAGLMLQDVMVDAAVATTPTDRTIFEAIAAAKRERASNKVVIEDPLGTKLTMKRLIIGANILARKLEGAAEVGGAVGIMLPNSAGVAVVFLALQNIGRVPAMINFTAGAASIRASCLAASVKTVVTSRAFVDKGRLQPLVDEIAKSIPIIYVEDIRASITTLDKLRGMLRGAEPMVTRRADDPAAILFTSGSEGTPKGVVLSHRNLLANIAQCINRVDANGEDKVFNALPVFHSFGLTAGMLMPLVSGIPIYMYPTPLHYRIIPELVYGTGSTLLFGTDTFLNGYARVAHPYDFHKVRFIMAGAEAVKDRTRAVYAERFGVRILEGYGVTETAPVLAMNSPIANKVGTVGRLSPLMQHRLEPVPGIEARQGDSDVGRLFVKGPNVMLGYYRAERPGIIEAPVDGWHDTGDIVAIDPQGYITIKGRAKRFAKIGGEMISLSAVEALASEVWPSVVSIVVSVPDARKGERLVLLTQDIKAKREEFLRHAKSRGISELSVPAEIMVVDRIPLLGSGKPDFVAASKLARERYETRTVATVSAG
jgi:acyl-[acyl-carrier-protein]-phospholipid O-acyltransferase/long-chain-fatty-acid--[acyl-carrier-protein] ligase